MSRYLSLPLAAALTLAIAPRPVQAQGADAVDVLTQYLLKQKLIELPKTVPSDKQVAAPAAANGTTTLVSGPSFPEIIGLAFDNNVASFKDGVFTVDTNAFAFKALVRPEVEIDQTIYGTRGNSVLRRIGLALSVGGKGEKFDRNGDGKADDPLTANDLTDIVTAEIRVRVFGSRDRRDDGNFGRFVTDVDAAYQQLLQQMRLFFTNHALELPRTAQRNANGDAMLDVAKFNEFLARPELQGELKTLADAFQVFVRSHEAEVKAIDQRAVWTLVLGGTQHADDFGRDRLHVALRGVMSGHSWNHTVNIDWNHASEFGALEVADAYTASYEGARLLFKGGLSDEGVKLSLAASVEFNDHVPEAKHTNIVKASAGFEIPTGSKLSVPITLSYANHADLLTADHVWAGQIGLAWDFSGKKK